MVNWKKNKIVTVIKIVQIHKLKIKLNKINI